MSVKLAISFSLIFSLVVKIKCQEEGAPCETPDSRYGVCINVKQCEEIVNILRAGRLTPQKIAYIRSFQCAIKGKTPLVCCPSAQLKINNEAVVPVNPNENNEDITQTPPPTLPKLLKPPDCGYSNKSDPRIVGGKPATLGEFPWIAVLGYKNARNPQLTKWLCGGALITKRHVLTAGHCIKDNLYVVRLGELDLYDDQEGANPVTVRIEKKIQHEDYNPSAHTYDIAILKLEEFQLPPMVWPICLPWEDNLKTQTFERYQPFVAGWGSTNFNGPSSAVLMKAALPVINNDNCKRVYEKQAIIDEKILCAGYATGGRDSCQGDSGGPMMLGRTEGDHTRFYLIGVVSYGFRCAEPGYPGVYSRVTHFIDWIQRNIN